MAGAADVIIDHLKLEQHPEGGWFREVFRDTATDADGRARSTSIYYLLKVGETSAWHRVTDAAETWHWYAGAPLVLTVSPNGHDASAHRLGSNFALREEPQFTVPAGWWQTATSLGEYTLVGCTVAPAFVFSSFELAPPDWRPTPRPAGGRSG
ncbi:cupin domain-containing protein [Consotaella aegiceratis]|uniref:cupin domain-containing protein n=1 Tax=Consotaella aegiceratis TaxID=3097961 RepID=UPI002F401683